MSCDPVVEVGTVLDPVVSDLTEDSDPSPSRTDPIPLAQASLMEPAVRESNVQERITVTVTIILADAFLAGAAAAPRPKPSTSATETQTTRVSGEEMHAGRAAWLELGESSAIRHARVELCF
jgi:hypothetical protein